MEGYADIEGYGDGDEPASAAEADVADGAVDVYGQHAARDYDTLVQGVYAGRYGVIEEEEEIIEEDDDFGSDMGSRP